MGGCCCSARGGGRRRGVEAAAEADTGQGCLQLPSARGGGQQQRRPQHRPCEYLLQEPFNWWGAADHTARTLWDLGAGSWTWCAAALPHSAQEGLLRRRPSRAAQRQHRGAGVSSSPRQQRQGGSSPARGMRQQLPRVGTASVEGKGAAGQCRPAEAAGGREGVVGSQMHLPREPAVQSRVEGRAGTQQLADAQAQQTRTPGMVAIPTHPLPASSCCLLLLLSHACTLESSPLHSLMLGALLLVPLLNPLPPPPFMRTPHSSPLPSPFSRTTAARSVRRPSARTSPSSMSCWTRWWTTAPPSPPAQRHSRPLC